MSPQLSPQEAYRRIDFDARVAGADPQELVRLCFEQFLAGLGSALWASARHDNALKSRSLTRALSALAALELGVDPQAALGAELLHLYRAARATLLDSVLDFDPKALSAVRDDFLQIGRAMANA